MADISDVEEAMLVALTSALYPNGTGQSSIVGALCRIYRGWPNTPTLNTDLNNGIVNVTVVADNTSGAITTRYLPAWHTTAVAPGTSATAIAETITFSGNPSLGDLIGILIDGFAYTYRVNEGDGPDQIAGNITQTIQGRQIAVAKGPKVTVPGARSMAVRIVCDNTTMFESRRQEKNVRVVCWCPHPIVRDTVAAVLDSALDRINFLPLADDTQARVIYKNTESHDQAQNALLYRRDLIYTVEYPSVSVLRQPSMLFGASDTNGTILYG